jgi:hypothetical protein
MGLYCGQAGGRQWRRQLSELADGQAGLRTLQQLARDTGEDLSQGRASAFRLEAPMTMPKWLVAAELSLSSTPEG